MTSQSVAISTRFRETLKKVPGLRFAKRKAWDFIGWAVRNTVERKYHRTIESLPIFTPVSAGSARDRARLTVFAANQVLPLLSSLIDQTRTDRLSATIRAESLCTEAGSIDAADKLAFLFRKHGSDKAGTHNYQHIYGSILRNPASVTSVLEIGLGTNYSDIVSSMGPGGKPGASLRAFRDFLPNARIYGADIDARILFEEERISTFFVDQTDAESLENLGAKVGGNCDLIVDDGLHAPNANISVLVFALNRLKPGGWLVIEDVSRSAYPVWKVVAALLPKEYKPYMIEGTVHMVFAVQRLGQPGSNPDTPATTRAETPTCQTR